MCQFYQTSQANDSSEQNMQYSYIKDYGPLLFLCYINDLPRIFINNVKLVLFADDTSLIVSD
jgi:hypothetical protein